MLAVSSSAERRAVPSSAPVEPFRPDTRTGAPNGRVTSQAAGAPAVPPPPPPPVLAPPVPAPAVPPLAPAIPAAPPPPVPAVPVAPAPPSGRFPRSRLLVQPASANNADAVVTSSRLCILGPLP